MSALTTITNMVMALVLVTGNMANTGVRSSVNLGNSISTDTVNEDIYSFEDNQAPLVSNNGIYKLGGIKNINETEVTFSETGKHAYTDNGQLLESIDAASDLQNIKVDGLQIGQVSSYGVESRSEIKGFDDVALTVDDTYMTLKLAGSVVTISEYSLVNVLLHTRSVTFTNLGPLFSFITSIGFVRYQPMHYVDSQEFSLRMGDQFIVLKESTPSQTIIRSISTTTALGASIIRCSVVYNGFFIVAGDGGKVASFDGINWKNADGTGNGQGPFYSGLLGGDTIGCMGIYNAPFNAPVGAGRLIFGGFGNGRVASLTGFSFNDYNSTVGIRSNGTVLGAVSIQSICQSASFMIFGGGSGRLGSFDSDLLFHNYDGTGTGTGPINNGGVLGASAIQAMASNYLPGIGGFLYIGGVGGRFGSWDGTNFKNYDGTGTGTGPNSNAVVVGASDINAIVRYSTFIVIGASQGRLGSWDGTNFKTYLGTLTGTGPFNNAGVIGADNIQALCVFGSFLMVCGTGDKLGGWDGTNWKNSDGTGTGTSPFSSTILGATGNIHGLTVYLSVLMVSGSNGAGAFGVVNSITSAGVQGSFYTESTTVYAQLFSNMNTFNYLYVYRYENGLYLVALTNNAQNKLWILNNSTNAVVSVRGRYAWPQVSSSKTRHIVSETPRISTDLFVLSLVGYTDFSTFTSTQQYQSNGLSVSSILHSQIGWTYGDVTLKQTTSADNIFNYYGPQPVTVPSLLANVYQGNTDTLISGHGKLTNAFGVVPVTPFEIRVNWIAANNVGGNQNYLSASIIDTQATDAVGVILTGVGEFFDGYQPMVDGDDTILYQFNGVFLVIRISKTIVNRLQRINDRLWKINTLSPNNIYDSFTKTLEFGSLDYNGKMIFTSVAVPTTNTKVVSIIESTFSNAVDTGDKLIQIPTPTSANIQVFGYRIPLATAIYPNYHVDTYFDDAYSYSTFNDSSELVLSDPANPVYVSDTRLPVPIGVTYYDLVAVNNGITYFLNQNNNDQTGNSGYDGYEIGNDIVGSYRPFLLYGQVYLFDGLNIFQANIQTNILQSVTILCDAIGMVFIATAPTEAYFLSSFDNSLYTFNGGRSLNKIKSFTALDTISQGVFNVKDNTLLLDSTNNLIWVRDGIVTQNAKKTTQLASTLNLFSTQTGIYIANQLYSWLYSYNTRSGSTVVPLSFQIAYFGQLTNQKSILKAFIATIYNRARTVLNITVTEKSKDQDEQYTEIHHLAATNPDFDSLGYYHMRIQPKYQSSLGSSLKFDIPEDCVVLDVSVIREDLAGAVIASGKSK